MKKLFCCGKIISECGVTALSFSVRLLGLSWRRKWPERNGKMVDAYIFPECSAVHTFFMFMAADVVFVDRHYRVVRTVHSMPPWRMAFGGRGAVCAIELPAGCAAEKGIIPGCVISVSDQQEVTLPPID